MSYHISMKGPDISSIILLSAYKPLDSHTIPVFIPFIMFKSYKLNLSLSEPKRRLRPLYTEQDVGAV